MTTFILALIFLFSCLALYGYHLAAKRHGETINSINKGEFPECECEADVKEAINSVISEYYWPHIMVRSSEQDLQITLNWNRRYEQPNTKSTSGTRASKDDC
jgi:hypothetical protein